MKKVSLLMVVAVVATAALAAGCGGGGDAESTASSAASGDVATAAGASPLGAEQAAATGGALPGITVVGTGNARAVPDVADWSFGVRADAATASGALQAAGSTTRAIVAALKNAGIAKADLRTEQVSLYPNMSEDGRTVSGYSASSSVHATVRDISKAGAVIDAAVGAGANEVYGPTLRVSDTREQYRSAAEQALDDARTRAEALAAKAGLTLGGPIAIIESGGPMPYYGERTLAADAAESVPIEPGVNEITATLTVTFSIA